MPNETIDELEAAGLVNVTKPREFGGFELPCHVFHELVMEIAMGCPSSGWVYSVIGEHNQAVGAKGAIEMFIDDIRARPPPGMGGEFKTGELHGIQMPIAEPSAEIDAARRMLLDNLPDAHEFLVAHEELPREVMARSRRDMVHAPIPAKRSVDRTFHALCIRCNQHLPFE